MDTADGRARFEDALKIASGKHDMVGIRVYDRREQQLPDVGILELKDAETGEKSVGRHGFARRPRRLRP